VAIGVDGAIRLTGPVLFDGYVGDPGLTDEVLRDGWLYARDLGRFDADGHLDVIGRADDVVQSGGVSIAVPAVERRISGMPNVSECAVVAVPDAEWGCRLIAYVVTDAGRPAPSLAQMRDFVSAAHPRSWAPRDVVVTTRLPYLESGKIDHRALRLRSGAAPSP
ncbi:MAG: class I adenylate-forming enzyme family protein, partial [Lapillicoccus sp.]